MRAHLDEVATISITSFHSSFQVDFAAFFQLACSCESAQDIADA